jgi:malate dehydrogenase
VIDCVNSIHSGTPPGDWTSLAVVSHGEYGIPEGLIFSYPVAVENGSWRVVEGIEQGPFALERIEKTTEELLQERDLVRGLVAG